MMKLINRSIIGLLWMLSACNSTSDQEIQLKIAGAPGQRVSYSTQESLWKRSQSRLLDSTGQLEIKQNYLTPTIIDVKESIRTYATQKLFLEPGDRLSLQVREKEGGFDFVGGDSDVIERNLLYGRIIKMQRRLSALRSRYNYHKRLNGEVIDSLCDVVNTFYQDEKVNIDKQSSSFIDFITLDKKYFLTTMKVIKPYFVVQTYYPFRSDDLAMMSDVLVDAANPLVVNSQYFRSMASAYADYLRIEDPKQKLSNGCNIIGNELALAEYFPQGDVKEMMKTTFLSNISYGMEGNDEFARAIDQIDSNWNQSLQHCKEKQTVSKGGRKISKGVEFPSFSGETVDGKHVELTDLKGKWVFIDVWATWCGPCVFEIPFVKKMEHRLKGENIVFLSLSVDDDKDREKWKQMIKDKQMQGEHWRVDRSQIYQQFPVSGIPHFALINPEGEVVYKKLPRVSTGVVERVLRHHLQSN